MYLALTSVIVAGLALLTLWALWFACRDRAVILRQLWLGAAVEGLLLVQVVTTTVMAVRGHHLGEPATWWGYIITSLLLLPIAAAWAFAERTRWSSVVLVVAAVATAVVQWRLVEIWG